MSSKSWQAVNGVLDAIAHSFNSECLHILVPDREVAAINDIGLTGFDADDNRLVGVDVLHKADEWNASRVGEATLLCILRR